MENCAWCSRDMTILGRKYSLSAMELYGTAGHFKVLRNVIELIFRVCTLESDKAPYHAT